MQHVLYAAIDIDHTIYRAGLHGHMYNNYTTILHDCNLNGYSNSLVHCMRDGANYGVCVACKLYIYI
jgi:hypothetical protein